MNEKTSIQPGRYRHYKGSEYAVIGTARHSETLEELVLYRQEYGDHGLWVRPQQMFSETVNVDGKDVPRFQPLGSSSEQVGESVTTFAPGPIPNTVRAADGKVLTVPDGWVLLPPGDAVLTRRVKADGGHWVVQERKGRKLFSRGVWAPAATIARIRAELAAERSTESYAKRHTADAKRREKAQEIYVEDFTGAVVTFLAFHPNHANLAHRLARVVADHATPIGSGTVARTKRIPVEQRAEAAVIAWMRHQTTGYDSMPIPRIRGKRREVQRLLAQRSHDLLDAYRRGTPVSEKCPLLRALSRKREQRVESPNTD